MNLRHYRIRPGIALVPIIVLPLWILLGRPLLGVVGWYWLFFLFYFSWIVLGAQLLLWLVMVREQDSDGKRRLRWQDSVALSAHLVLVYLASVFTPDDSGDESVDLSVFSTLLGMDDESIYLAWFGLACAVAAIAAYAAALFIALAGRIRRRQR
ncbi:hypothetical protein [Corynebacterium liangguodongii]|uniref:Uncharacterized protein n=1 Tax=Corynebacterium liangguodongii TaxID=2079535 RepID=A0A2S0WDZ0_9CORY|nr:hypothetical protein [Corynebacterium liangguodongii]AWB83995.1 hypothetical protein C3E79_05475 [Corynebacterium liangguodongii]PWC00007.1 hypothetical protein DF219_02115 [Corynebacterium liangguodongii]